MIIGVGTDIVEIARVQKLIEDSGESFIRKIFNDEERVPATQLNAARHYAKRFAAKEAISKALGSGIGKLNFKHITITNNADGQPLAKVFGVAHKIHLSIADEKDYATAFAVVES